MRGYGRLRRALVLIPALIISGSGIAALTAATGSGAAVPVLDHFECYTASAVSSPTSPKPFSVTPNKVLLKNKFASGGFVTGPGAVQMHCNPVQKTAVQSGHSVTTPITNPDAHLVCQAVGRAGVRLPASVIIKNQFGTGGVAPKSVKSLCLPSWTATAAPAKFPAQIAPANLDMFVCYAITHPSGTPSFTRPASVTLKDQFGTVTTTLGAPNTLCLPSSQTLNPYGGPSKIVNPDRYTVCFAIPPAKSVTTRTVYDKNQFGVGAVKTTRATQLCVPSTVVAPVVTTTTGPTTTTLPPGIVTNYSYPSIDGPYDIAAGSDGALWFSNYFSDSIGRITTDGTVSNYPSYAISRPDGVGVGPDGAMWFANTGDSTIGRVAPDGSFSRFVDPRIRAPSCVAAGPGLVTWFTNSTASSVGWITPNGSITTFSDPRIQNPQGITAGPDGAMWFANFYGNSIGRATVGGKIDVYTDPHISFPLSIVTGPDGALWFTNPGNSSIGRIATDGTVTSFTNYTMSVPIDICVGSDGALWFTNYSNSTIGRITTSGVISNYADPTISSPDGIGAGPDGAIWFTNAGNNTIGRISV